MSQQIHSGSGDNVAGNKTTNISVKTTLLAIAILAIGGISIAIALWPEAPKFAGTVVSSADIPVPDAQVILRITGKEPFETFTDASGNFIFPKVNPEDVEQYVIEAKKEEREISQEGTGADALNNPVVVKLPPGKAPFDVAYYTVTGDEGIMGILSGKASADLEKKIGGQPYIIANTVWQHLKSLEKEFSGDQDRFQAALNGDFYHHIKLDDQQLKTLLSGVSGWQRQEEFNGPFAEVPAAEWDGILTAYFQLRDEFAHLNFQSPEAQKVMDRYFSTRRKIGSAKKFANPKDLEYLFPFYSSITKDYLPDRFLRIGFGMQCGGEVLSRIEYEVAPIKMKIAVISNRSAEPLNIGDFYFRENPATKMRDYARDKAALEKTDILAKKVFPKDQLNPGECILVPLWTYIGEGKGAEKGDYMFGPSWEIEDVDIGIERYAVREYDPKLLALYFEGDIGSCPYAYTQLENGDWSLENHILARQNSKQKEGGDTLLLKRFTGQLLIKELDPETSYIDHIHINYVGLDGKVIALFPEHKKLGRTDGNYLVMHTGDTVQLHFPGFDPNAEGQYYLISSGYYLPDHVQ